MHKAFPLSVIEFPRAEEVPTARESLSIHITFILNSQQEMDQQNPTLAKLPILDTRKFEQWQFRIQQYLQHEHYALWEVIEFGDSYEVPASTASTTTTDTTSGGTGKKSRRTVTLTAEAMQKRKNDVKARTTLLLSLPDEHQLRFKVKQDDLNQKFLTSLPPEWLMHTIVWRNRSDLDTMSLDDLYNHLKVYEYEVHKKLEPNSQNIAFISSAKHSRGNEDVNTASVSTASTNVPTASANNGKKTWKKISIQGSDVTGFDKSKVECFNCHKMGHFARECRAPRSQDRGRRDNYRQGSKVKEQAPKALMAIDGAGWDWSYIEMMKMIMHYVVPPHAAQIYSSPKKDLSWTGLLEFANDTITDYSRPSPNMESTSGDDQNRNPSIPETDASPSTITPKPFIKFVKPNDSPSKSKTGKTETPKKSPVKYAEQYRKPNKKLNVRGNQRNWKILKSHQLGPNFVMKKKACFNCGHFDHLSNNCRKRVKKGTSRSQNNTYERFTPRPIVHRPYRPPVKPMRTNMNGARPNRTYFYKQAHLCENRPFQRTSAVKSQFRAPWIPTANKNFPVKFSTGGIKFSTADMGKKGKAGSSQNNTDDKCYWDSGCSRHMTGNISYLSDYEPFDGGYVSFGQGGCKITGKGTIKTECTVLGRHFKLLDDANILLRTPRHNLVRGLPTKCFKNDHTCTACLKGKQHKASCKSKIVNSMTKPLHTLHMDLLGPTSKGIKRKFSNARTPQHNGVAERRKWTLIEAARTMLADAKLPVTFWAEAVNTACYVLNMVLVNMSHNKTPYKLFNGRSPAIGFLKPFGCHVMILNTLDNLGKFEEKRDEGYFIGYSMSSKAFRVFNKRTRRVEENLHVEFLENKAIEKGAGPNWLFDIDSLTKSMNYVPVDAVPTACFTDSPEPLSDARLISKRVANQVETPSLDNILTLTNRFEDILGVTTNSDELNGVEADVSNTKTTIIASPTLTLRIHKDHPKSQIIGPVATPIQTRNKSKEMDMKSAFLYGTINEEVYVMQPPGF
nr:ribonuclease H-like domain-containing protein [Tanacetum cinerariifolium]